MNDTFPGQYDFAAEERAEQAFSDSIGQAIADAINKLPLKNAETMAKTAYEVVCTKATEYGQKPEIECFIKGPDESHNYLGGTPGVWIVCWEAGPYTWAYNASMAITVQCGKLCEPYYSFDLTFYPAED